MSDTSFISKAFGDTSAVDDIAAKKRPPRKKPRKVDDDPPPAHLVRGRYDVNIVKDRIDLADLARRYGAEFRKLGRYQMSKCPLPHHSDRTPSFVVYDDTQHFHCFGCQAHGDALNLIALFLGLDLKRDFRRVIEEAAAIAGVGREYDAAAAEEARKRVEGKRKAQAKRDEDERRAKAERAKTRWLKARVIQPTDIHARYFREARGVDLFRDLKRPPGAIRVFNAFRWNIGADGAEDWREFPVVCTAMTRFGAITATHLTFLKPDGSNLEKTIGQKGRIMLGSPNGASMHIQRGKSGLTPKEAFERFGMDDVVALTEGLEDALSVAALQPDWRVWSCYSLDNIGNAEIHECAGELVICGQNDRPQFRDGKPTGPVATLEKVKEKLLRRAGGRTVKLAMPPEGLKDWNEVHQNV